MSEKKEEQKLDEKGKLDESPAKELNVFVENLLKEMQDRFEEMSNNIIGRIDEMGKI